jgi:hypothetical protein
VSAYFLYRINPAYDGFLPSRIPQRSRKGVLPYNWSAYVENLSLGDIVLTYFTDAGCRPGIYAVAVIESVDIAGRQGNVLGRLLHFSDDDTHPLIPVRSNEDLFRRIRTRPRGAEIIVPESCEKAIYQLLVQDDGAVSEARSRNIYLPGSEPFERLALADVPRIRPRTQLSQGLRDRGLVSAFWIRPHQASWITRPPDWLSFVSNLFRRFKAGDLSRLSDLAKVLADQVSLRFSAVRRHVGLVLAVPLNAAKREAGEIDRAGALGEQLAQRLGLPYSPALELAGAVSRRLYKNSERSDADFRSDYRANLTIRRTRPLLDCLGQGRDLLLVDDVYTDGVTTETIAQALKDAFPENDLRVNVATLGLMAKLRNMAPDLANRWR